MNQKQKEGYITYQDKLCKLIGAKKKDLKAILEKKDLYSKYWQSAFTWTKEQRDEFRDWADQFFNKKGNEELKEFFFEKQALELYKDDFSRLLELWVDTAGWRMEGTEIRPLKPDYLYVNAPEKMPVIWTRDEFHSCSFNELSRFWVNTEYAIEERDEIGVSIYSQKISDDLKKELKIEDIKDVYGFQGVGMELINVENDHPQINWIRENFQKFFFKETIDDAILEELNVNWEK